MKKILIAVFLFSISCPAAFAGIYMGADTDHNDTSFYYIGGQTEEAHFSDKNVFLSVLLGKLEYQFLSGITSVEVKSTIITPMIGYKFDGKISTSVSIGATWTEKEETRGGIKTTDRGAGAVAQLGLSYWRPEKNYEFLVSYNGATDFIWSRARGKHLVREALFLGGEIFLMGDSDFRSQGVGVLLEIKGKKLSGLLKVGVSNIKNGNSGTYGGVELSFPISF